MKENELWEEFITKMNINNCDYEAWAFGGDADYLANLVLAGEKKATSSAFSLYKYETEYIPVVGEYSIILDSNEDAVCVIRTTSVSIVPFDEITADHAYKEGEGDKSLNYWRSVHEKFFTECLNAIGLDFTVKMKVVFEEFEVVYIPTK